MTAIIFSIIFALFNNSNLKDKTFIMSFEEQSKLPVFDETETCSGLLIVKYPLSYVYKHYYDENEETIVSNGEIVKIISTPKNKFDDEQIIYKKQSEFFTKKDLETYNYKNIVIINKNKVYYNEVLLKMIMQDGDIFKNVEILYYEPSYRIKYIKYETNTGVRVSLYPSFQERVNFELFIF